ncbi:DsbA family protein [Intrasporangium calvum]|uniref:DsbA family protein n=1 Tax=Intrasporangium calvum TaxID=53358 RepID=A0ABT5GEM0_9MICO|nr:DsbA family protein [Intrasporangium calvum]MDC5696702.1 DsbA family protein [Intrasporangium calvum]
MAESAEIIVWGDFTCPWSHLAWRRTEVLIGDGVAIDWRTVEHERWHHLTPAQHADRVEALHREVRQVRDHLQPGETLPHSANGHVPFTAAATSAYAEAYASDVARVVRRRLFDAFWEDGLDLNDPRLLRPLLATDLRGAPSTCEQVWRWGHACDVTGGPLSGAAWHLVRDWRSQWRQLGRTVPTVRAGGLTIVGVEAVDWLGEQVRGRGLVPWDDQVRGQPAA